MKVINLFKAKKEGFRDKSSPKVKNDSILLHLTLRFLARDENHFLRPQARNLAQTNGFWYILLWMIFDAQRY